MQVLPSTDVIPNLTLRRLIDLWSQSQSGDVSALSPPITRYQLLNFVKNLIHHKIQTYSASLLRIADFANSTQENRQFLATIHDFLPAIIRVLISVNEIEVLESGMNVIGLIIAENGVKQQLNKLVLRSNRDCLSPFILVLRRGNLNARIQSARVLESISLDAESQRVIAENQGLLFELYRLLDTDETAAIDAGLSVLLAISGSRLINKSLVEFGIVKTAARILLGGSKTATEKTLKLLQVVCTGLEGRTAICEDDDCLSSILQMLMKLSDRATEHGITVVWNVCYLFRDRMAQEAVMRSNGMTKVLLVMQSNCSVNVRQMCRDLVKVFRVYSKSGLANYETTTSHIMPY
jgi:hypothetical protein